MLTLCAVFFIEGIILPKWSWSHITPHKANWWPISSMVDLMMMLVMTAKKRKERDKALIMVEIIPIINMWLGSVCRIIGHVAFETTNK